MEETKEQLAVDMVYNHFYNDRDEMPNLKLVWFCKTLKNWKAMVADISKDGSFFEVTHNGEKNEIYIDEYIKQQNLVVKN